MLIAGSTQLAHKDIQLIGLCGNERVYRQIIKSWSGKELLHSAH